MNETSSILILALITIVLAIYTLLGMKLCTKANEIWLPKWLPWLKENRFRVLLVFPLGWLLMATFVIVAPLLLLGYLMNDYKLIKDIGPTGRGLFFLGWIIPTGIYIIVHLVRKNKLGEK